MDILHAYAIFCDANNLPRIDASRHQHIANLHEMVKSAMSLMESHQKQLQRSEKRYCSNCGERQ